MNSFFAQMLHASGGRPPIGTWLVSASHVIAEAVGCAGFDWAVIDMERGEVKDVLRLLQALAATQTLPVVRVPSHDAVLVKRVLDAGGATVLLAHVASADAARRAVAATRLGCASLQGDAAMTRASRYGTAPNGAARNPLAVIVEIASLQAIEQLDALAQVDGVDAFFLGVSDLAASLGHAGRADHPAVVEQLTRAVQRCKALGKPIGVAAPSAPCAAQYRAAGFDFIAVASDLGLMMSGAHSVMAALRTTGDARVHALAPWHANGNAPTAYPLKGSDDCAQ
ncbi:MAG: aldolase/citrate lyase family protein [Burkholderiaceae bacterium]